jgi:signal peptidase I
VTNREEAGPEPASDPGPGSPARGRRVRARSEKQQLPLWQEMILLLVLALVLAIIIKAFFLQAFYIPSGSMENTLRLNDRILVEKVTTWNGASPNRGDVVVFSDPGGWLDPSEERPANGPLAKVLELFGLYPTGGHLVKRVIGVGGDTVKCCDEHGRILVDGVPLNEQSYVKDHEPPSLIHFKVHVPKGYIWVMGDNRSNSADSRVHLGDPGGGMVPVEDVVGKVFAIVWPLDHATLLHRPATFDNVGP